MASASCHVRAARQPTSGAPRPTAQHASCPPSPPPALRVRHHHMAWEAQSDTSCSTSLQAHSDAQGRSASLLLAPGHVRNHAGCRPRGAAPGSAYAEPREPKLIEGAERLGEGAPGSRQQLLRRCSRDVAPGCSLRPWSTEEVTARRRPSSAAPCPQPARPRPPHPRGPRGGFGYINTGGDRDKTGLSCIYKMGGSSKGHIQMGSSYFDTFA